MTIKTASILGVVFVILCALLAYAQREADKLRAQRDLAVSQAALNASVSSIADKAATQTRVIIQQTESAAHEVEAIPSDRLPDDVRAAWLRGLAAGPPSGNSGEP